MGANVDLDYLKSVPGIIKFVEAGLSIIVIGCLTVYQWFLLKGGGFVMFTAVISLISSLTFFFLNFLCLFSRLPIWRLLLEFAWLICLMIAYFVCGVLSGFAAPAHAAIGAATFFCFVACLTYGADAFFAFWIWRAGSMQEAAKNAPSNYAMSTEQIPESRY